MMKKDESFDFPDCWEEITPEEWMHLLYLCHIAEVQWLTLWDVKCNWCNHVVIRREHGVRKGDAFLLLVDRLAHSLNWVFKEGDNPHEITLNYTSTVNLMPVWESFVGPQDHGADMTFGEFRHAVTAFNTYNQTHDAGALLQLVAILYRPAVDAAKRRRCPFNPDEIGENMERIARTMPDYYQWGVYVWFASFCRFVYQDTFVYEGSEVSFAPLFGRQASGEPSPGYNLGMNSILFTVADSGVFGTAEGVDNTPLMRVLLKLLDDKQRADELIRQTKQKN